MGRDLWESSAAARDVFETADRVLGFSITQLCAGGPEEKLRDTRFAQPAILTASIACLAAAVESGFIHERPAFVAGHSLGEYSALVAAGALSVEDGLRLIEERARLMAEAGEAQPGTLAAIIGMDEGEVLALCDETGVDPCNLNLPSQTVIGGTREAVARAMELAKARGAQRAIELNVSGAFHSRLMAPAVPGLKAAVEAASIESAAVTLIANATATPISDPQAIRQELGAQIASAVRWHESVARMAEAGVTTFIEFGPGKVLTGLVKRLVPGATLLNIGTFREASPSPSLAGPA
jgi:[acyl-carrier-protein] S-malonyltransferase